MIGKLAHVRSRRDVLIASLVITGVSVACAMLLTACVTRSAKSAVDFGALRNAAEIAAVIAFAISFLVVDAIRRILKGKRSIERLAMTDDLTGLSNRRALLAAAERAIARIDGVALPPALLIVDLDHFKRVNDVYGHRAGDQALQAAAEALARSVRGDVDFVGRLGGEEFVVLLAAADEETARRAAESARAAIAAMRVAAPNGEIAVTASIGYTPLVAGDTVSTALQRADEALYAAKRAGRNQIASRAPNADERPAATVEGRLRRDAPERLRRSA
ncbi:MAG: GGDEF domain-containing protein [Roseiarcus sp.]|uniref:GGDEF domain-containing protein n=1 Tax=Roseiarcus sp. TaxID=1969460 RepID=UPI003C276523